MIKDTSTTQQEEEEEENVKEIINDEEKKEVYNKLNEEKQQHSKKETQYKQFWKEKRKRVKIKRKQSGRPTKRGGRRTKREMELHPPHVFIDCSYSNVLSSKEVRSVSNQIGHTYGVLKKSDRPVFLHLSSVEGAIEAALHNHSGYEAWQIHRHSEPWWDLLSDPIKHGRVLYLSPDATDVVKNFTEYDYYIIGGIADKNIIKGLSLSNATKHKVPSACLPLKEYKPDISKTVLNVNHMVDIIVSVCSGEMWLEVLSRVTPSRRSYRKEECNERKENGDKKEGQKEKKREEEKEREHNKSIIKEIEDNSGEQ